MWGMEPGQEFRRRTRAQLEVAEWLNKVVMCDVWDG